MGERVDFYSSYAQFTERVMRDVRRETFGDDIGQNSWVTVEEFDRLVGLLGLSPGRRVLEVASGSGGPAVHLARTTGCDVTGVDVHESAVEAATKAASAAGLDGRVRFSRADANAPLPFPDSSFDGVVCIDSMNHLPDRLGVLREWRRVLRPGGRALFTDPVVVTGAVTADELSLRASVGVFLFTAPGVNEGIIERAGLALVHREDVTENAAVIAGRWHGARAARRDELERIEGAERFEGVQRFFDAVHRLSAERRLSRIAYVVERRAG